MKTNSNPFDEQISKVEKLLENFEQKLNDTIAAKTPSDVVPLSEVSLADEAWHSKMAEGKSCDFIYIQIIVSLEKPFRVT